MGNDSDIVARLHVWADAVHHGGRVEPDLLTEAADTIERLERELLHERIRAERRTGSASRNICGDCGEEIRGPHPDCEPRRHRP
jgi:hypothetical protein